LMTADEVMAEISHFRLYYQSWIRGITISGREPLVQPQFCHTLLRRFRNAGFVTALETTGHVNLEPAKPALQLADLVVLDLLAFDSAHVQRMTGVSPEKILATAEYLQSI